MPPDTQTPTAIGPFALGGVVTTPYGVPNAINGAPHTGVDIGGLPIGTAIPAFVGGVVSRIWRDAAGGNQVSVKTAEGFTQTYAHLSAVNVSPNQQVSGSDIIGFLGNTGTTTGPHLHYEVQQPNGVVGFFGTSVDPQTFLSEFFTSSPSLPSGSGPGQQRVGNGPRPRSLSPTPTADACASVPGETVQSIKNYIRDIGALSAYTPGGDAAALVKGAYPSVSVACLQQVAYSLAKDNTITGQTDFFSQAAQVLADLQSHNLWARAALTMLGASLIVVGVILYTKPSAVGEATKIVRAAA